MPRPASPVKTVLAARGITMTEVSGRLGIKRTVLYAAINRGPTWPKLRRELAALLDVDEGELFPEHAKPLANLADSA